MCTWNVTQNRDDERDGRQKLFDIEVYMKICKRVFNAILITLKLISTRVRPVWQRMRIGTGRFLEYSDLSRTDCMVG